MATTTYEQKVPGPNTTDLQTIFQSERKTLAVNLGKDITGYTVSADYQAKVWTGMTIDRSDVPNFADAVFAGYFPKVTMTAGDVPAIETALTGDVSLIIPNDMYDGPLHPNTREVCVVVSVGLSWTDADGNVETLRLDYLQEYEPGVAEPGNPTGHTGYVAYT